MQPIPNVSSEDVLRIVKRDFPEGVVPEVVRLLALYGEAEWHRQPERVRLAILKLADGDIRLLRRYLNDARGDYRDTIAYAEQPNFVKKFVSHARISKFEREKIVQEDWRQYEEWLGRE